ncbi:MAG TPA: CHAT domain-containing protein [Vicinamibacterales bacterium]|nr:CHAT domain-containing protein [Vicinamibacterales bacterium]
MDAQRPCPDSALLAAFLDGALDGYERAAVVTHLAECRQCRAVALAVVEFHEIQAHDDLWQPTIPPPPAPPLVATRAIRWSREKTRAPALVLAAVAASAALAIPMYRLIPAWSAQRAVAALLDVAEGHRPLEARLSGANAYAPPPSLNPPGAAPRRPTLQLIATATDVRTSFEHDDAAPSRRAVGVAALLTGDLDAAIGTLEIAAEAAPRDTKLANDLAAAYYERSQRADRPDDLPAALSAVERVLVVDPSHLEALFNRALIISALGLRAEAGSAWQDYLARDPDSAWAHEARTRLAATTSTAVRPDWASLRSALDSVPRTSDAEAAVRYHASAARDYIENELLGRWVAAAKASDRLAEEQALARIEMLGDAFARLAGDHLYQDVVMAVRRARAENRQARSVAAYEEYLAGLDLMASQRFSEAAPVLRRARRSLATAGSPLSVRADIELAATAYYALRFKEAEGAMSRARSLARERRHAILVTRAAWLEGMAAFGLNEFAKARVAYEEMLASAVAAGDTDQWVMAKVLLANLHEILGEPSRAWQHRIDAADRLDHCFSDYIRSTALASASGDALAGGHHAAALLLQSLLLSAPAGVSANLEVQLRAQRARSMSQLGRQLDASRELAIARERVDTIADQQSRARVQYDLLGAEAEVLRDENPTLAIAAAEQALTLPLVRNDGLRRARIYLLLGEAAVRSNQLDRAEAAVINGLAALDSFRASPAAEFAVRRSDSVWRLYANAAQISLRRGDLARAFVYTERARMRTPQERRAWEAGIASLDEVQRSLGRDTALAVLTQLDEQLQIWVIRSDDIAAHTLPISSSRASALVARQLQEMMLGVSRPRASAELFDLLFRPASRLLVGVGQIVVVADAPYNQIAYAGLWDRRSNRYVVEDHAVVLAPNASAFTRAVERSRFGQGRPTSRRASIVGAPHGQSAPLGSASLAQSLGAVYGESRLTRNEAATATTLVEEVASGDVVHVVAQVVVNEQFPGLSHLQMADDPGQKYSGSVFARNVADSRPRAQLVALESRAGGTFGFARALLAAGIPNVVSSIADIEPGSVERTWLDFHRRYAAGTAAAESLRRAQLAALSASDRRPGPWATLTVFGSTQ